MNKKGLLVYCLIVVALCWAFFPDPAMAGPGGQIASALFRTLPGKILLLVLTILFLPVILYVVINEYIAERRTLKDLNRLAKAYPQFDWLELKERVTEGFHRVHAAWRKEQMQEASDWMTDWYWQNQQLAHLDQWERDGLVNHCGVRSIKSIRPLFVRFKNDNPGGGIDGSRVVVAINANMEDYLMERKSGKVVQGAKGYDDVETVWTFVYERNRWLVANIEQGMSLQYAKLVNQVPQVIPKVEIIKPR